MSSRLPPRLARARGSRCVNGAGARGMAVQHSTQSAMALDCGAATRTHPLMTVNGDAFVLKQWSTGALVGVIDGLGHGQCAHQAAQTAWQYVENHFDQPLGTIFRGAGHVCQATRGVVMA